MAKQLHLYEVPFYYIEYGMAQLGAIAMWRSYKMHGEKALDNYMDALRLLHQINWRAVQAVGLSLTSHKNM